MTFKTIKMNIIDDDLEADNGKKMFHETKDIPWVVWGRWNQDKMSSLIKVEFRNNKYWKVCKNVISKKKDSQLLIHYWNTSPPKPCLVVLLSFTNESPELLAVSMWRPVCTEQSSVLDKQLTDWKASRVGESRCVLFTNTTQSDSELIWYTKEFEKDTTRYSQKGWKHTGVMTQSFH